MAANTTNCVDYLSMSHFSIVFSQYPAISLRLVMMSPATLSSSFQSPWFPKVSFREMSNTPMDSRPAFAFLYFLSL